jgi:hypothetical protein
MPESPLSSWESFYVIVGSSAGALTGLQFVVMALIADTRKAASSEQISAFGTPTIVHFCVVLLQAATMSAPWPRVGEAAFLLGFIGMAGMVYVSIVTRRTHRQEGYVPVFEDWLWHAILPFIAYTMMLMGAIVLLSSMTIALFMLGTVALVLIFAGIHNAWDTVTFLVTNPVKSKD